MSAWRAELSYCGTAPAPDELWMRWNLDPVLLSVLLFIMIWHARCSGALHADLQHRAVRRYFIAGWSALIMGLVSPICALSVALFSARVTQHMWLSLIAAPLLVMAGSFTSKATPARRSAYSPMTAALLFAACLWLWHAPRLYALTFSSDVTYWLMHITLIGSSVLLWRTICLGAPHSALVRALAGFLTFVQMGLLGALLTLAPRTLYTPHLLTAAQWRLSALLDQQLGGLIMWVPAGLVLVCSALATVLVTLRTAAVAR